MRRSLLALAAVAAAASITGCAEERLPYEPGGRVYDVRLLVQPKAATTQLPGGSVAVVSSAGSVSKATLDAVRFPAGEYYAYLVDEATGEVGGGAAFTPDEAGKASVELTGGPAGATALLVSAGSSAGTPAAFWARFRNAATGAIAAKTALAVGHYADTLQVPYRLSGFGRIGLWEQGEFGSAAFRFGGVVQNLSPAPPGFTYMMWVYDDSTRSWGRVGTLLDEARQPYTAIDQLPPPDQVRELPKLYIETGAILDFRLFTHARLSLERQGSAPTRPAGFLYNGTFGVQFLKRRAQASPAAGG